MFNVEIATTDVMPIIVACEVMSWQQDKNAYVIIFDCDFIVIVIIIIILLITSIAISVEP